ncbi:phage tail tape measure protein [Ectopseudomonas khazarica]|nr:phage tail tape measure protein [Pseudomonas khazarica]
MVLQAIDKATAPIRAITQGSSGLGRALKASRDQLKSLNALQNDISSYKKQHTAVRETSEQLANAQQRMRGMREQLKGMTAPSAAFQKSFLNASREVDRLSRKHQEQRAELRQSITRFKEAGISTSSLKSREKTLGDEIDAVNRKIKAQKDRLAELTRQQERLARAKQQYQRTQGLSGSMAASGAGGLATGSSILYSGARLLAPGVAYGAQMSELQAITRLNKDDERFKALKGQARELGASTAFSANEVGAGQTFLARAGFTPEAIRASMGDILDLALANNTDLARTADIASNISSAFKIDPEVQGNITRVADVLSGTAARANVDLEMLGETMKYMGSAEGLGLTLEQAAAMSGLLGNIGIQSSQAGTTMRAMLNRLSAPVGAAKKSIAALGLEIANADGNMRDIPDLLGEIARKTKDMGNVERAAHLTAIFGVEPGSGMAELINQKGLGGLDKLLQELMNVQGENARMAKVMADNIDGDLKGLSSAWEEVGNTIADANEGPLRDFIQSITGVVRGISAWMKENPRLTAQILKTIAGLGMLLAIGGGLTVMLASVIGPFAMVRYGMMLLSIKSLGLVSSIKTVGTVLLWLGRLALANPIGLVITALVAGAYLIYRNWDRVVAFFSGIWAELKAGANGGISGITTTLLNFSPLGLFYRAFAAVMNYFGLELPGRFSEFGGMLIDGLVNGITNGLGRVKGAIENAGGATIGWFKDKLGIRSPSRVFATLGDDTMAGLAVGLRRSEARPLQQLASTAKQLTTAGAITLATAGSSLAMDNRPPLGARHAPAAQLSQPAPVTIHVHPSAGMDEQCLARLVAIEVARQQHAQQVRSRSSLQDQE